MGEKNRTGVFVKPHQAAILFDSVSGQWNFAVPRGVKTDGSQELPRGLCMLMAFMLEVQKGQDRQWSDDLIAKWFKPRDMTAAMMKEPPKGKVLAADMALRPALAVSASGLSIAALALASANVLVRVNEDNSLSIGEPTE